MHFSWNQISLIFAIMLLPFSIIPIYAGKYADKIGERNTLMLGFLVVSLSSLFIFFIQESNLWIWAIILFITRVGAAIVEVDSDAYFFKHIKPENEEYLGVYRSTSPIAYIFGPLLASLFLFFVPRFEYLYVVLGAMMLSGIYFASKILKSDI
jgi:MFS family permease